MRKSLILLTALLVVLTLTLTGCATAGGGMKDKIVGTYDSSLFANTELSSMMEMLGVPVPEGEDLSVKVEFTKEGEMRAVVGGKDLLTFIKDLTKDLPDEIKEGVDQLGLDSFNMKYVVKDESTITFTMGEESHDVTASWNGDVLTLKGSDGEEMTFTKIKK